MRPYNILSGRIDEQIAILGANRAIAFIDFVLWKWMIERHCEADSAAVTVCFVGCWLAI
jgi:hypothetical protein